MSKMIEIQKPKFEQTLENGETKFIIQPLEHGFGITLGNAIRRTLLSTLPGVAATAIKIEGVDNEFSLIPGIKEDVTDIILNIKSVYFKVHTNDPNFKKQLILNISNPGVVTAGMIELPLGVEILNPDQEICTLAEGASINMSIQIEVGRGYRQANENKSEDSPIDLIYIDSIFTPVQSARYEVKPCRVGQSLNFDELNIFVKTNGTEPANKILATSAKILYDQLKVIMDYANEDVDSEISYIIEEKKEEVQEKKTLIDSLELSVRSINCLKRARIKYLEEITNKTEEEMMNVKNLGQKSLDEIKQKLEEKGLGFRPKSQD